MQTEADRPVPPWQQPIARFVSICGDPALGPPSLNALNLEAQRLGVMTLSGRPVRFVPPREDEPSSAAAYERRIWDSGEVTTRQGGRGARHDGFNALCWLAFPQVRARLNALQAHALGLRGSPSAPSVLPQSGERGRLRDRVTLFDESGGLLLTRERELVAALQAANWQSLFLDLRALWVDRARLILVGHALHEKLVNPYKSICARVLWVDADPDIAPPLLDAQAASLLEPALSEILIPAASPRLQPLPVMGIPGWDPANLDPAFYRDPLVFRPRSA
jgi:hypothetical protein